MSALLYMLDLATEEFCELEDMDGCVGYLGWVRHCMELGRFRIAEMYVAFLIKLIACNIKTHQRSSVRNNLAVARPFVRLFNLALNDPSKTLAPHQRHFLTFNAFVLSVKLLL